MRGKKTMTDKEKIRRLTNVVETLCNNLSDQPAGCDACWLYEYGNCAKEALYEEMGESEEKNE
jgi:hypothetical protein